MEIDAINPLKCAEYIQKTAPLFAKAKADRTFIENYLKTVKAREMSVSVATSLGAKEVEAYSSAAYVEQLEALRIAVEQEEMFKWNMTSAQLKADIWKVTEYSKRAELRNLG